MIIQRKDIEIMVQTIVNERLAQVADLLDSHAQTLDSATAMPLAHVADILRENIKEN